MLATVKRLHSVVIVVEDLDKMVEFFVGLGFILDADSVVEGPWADSVLGQKDVRVNLIELLTPLGEGRIELLKYETPIEFAPALPVWEMRPGIKAVGVLFDDLDEGIERALSLGARYIGEGTGILGEYRIAYVLGPENIMLLLGEERPWW